MVQKGVVQDVAAPRVVRRGQYARVVVPLGLLIVAVAFGVQASRFWMDVVNLALIASIGAVGLNLLLGHTGLVSVGNAAFLGVGALTAAEVAIYLDLPFVAAVVAAAVVSGLIGVLLALPSVRIKGLYLAIATLALHFIIVDVIRRIQAAQVGDISYALPTADLFGWRLASLTAWYIFLVAALVLTLLFVRSLLVRKPGRIWRSIREQPTITAASGLSVMRYKVWAFVVSSALVGIAGSFQAYYLGNVSHLNFTLHLAILYLAMVIVGGLGSMYGPVAGAFFFILLPHVVQTIRDRAGFDIAGNEIFFIQGALAGLAIVAAILVEPRGLAALVGNATNRLSRGRPNAGGHS